eukprot:TRINITY_DN633_c0_g1_i1.p1 TRINITY_DN633_c0_g1~~TRINITY_DN633_c0_g1_i1.p1  ORF type:complete len:1136 (-),score=318.35 TRINITY_DN633_c0_g1_i1:525-3932(-)
MDAGPFVRRATREDIAEIESAIGPEMFILQKRFGQYTIRELIDLAHVSLVIVNEDLKVTGFASFNNYPQLVKGVSEDSWEYYLQERFGTDTWVATSMWMNFFFADMLNQASSLDHVLVSIFSTFPELENIYFHLSSEIEPYEPISERFCQIQPIEGGPEDIPFQFFTCTRESTIPSLGVRVGFVEDHDDLLELVESQGERLTELYGDYYLAEILEEQDEHTKTLVAEVKGEPVGLMQLSDSDFDPVILSSCFELEPFDNLLKDGYDLEDFKKKPWKKAPYGSDDADGAAPDDEESAREFRSSMCNAFRIRLFCISEFFESRAIDFLAPAFELFPEKEYCILTVPYTTTGLELLNVFGEVPARTNNTYAHALFLFSKYSLLREVNVDKLVHNEAFKESSDSVEKFVGEIPAKETIMGDIRRMDMTMTKSVVKDGNGVPSCFVMKCRGQIIGVATLHEHVNDVSIGSHFSIDEFLPFDQELSFRDRGLCLRQLILNPVFGNFEKFFLMEILRKTHKECIYHFVRSDSVLCPVMHRLIPVPPRRPIQILKGNMNDASTDEDVANSLLLSCWRLLSEPKINSYARIVIIGASDTALSLIYHLLMAPDVSTRNVTLVSPDGVPSFHELETSRFKPHTNSFLPCEYQRILRNGVLRVIKSKLVDFYRDKRMVVLDGDDGLVPYDYLVLATGLQLKMSRRIVPKNEMVPDGVFAPGTVKIQKTLLAHLKMHYNTKPKAKRAPILVYGWTLDAYCAVDALVKEGDVDPTDIILMTPKSRESTHLQVGELASKVNELLEESGVKLMPFHDLKKLYRDGSDQLNAALVQKNLEGDLDQMARAMAGIADEEPFRLACEYLVYCANKEVDDDILHAVNERALVFDGTLILKPDYRTEDNRVMAIGSVAKFSRRFGHAEPFELFHPREVAQKLENVMLPELLPEEFDENEEVEFPPTYNMPRAFSCTLFGKHFLRVWNPSSRDDKQVQLQQRSTDVDGNFISILTNDLGQIMEVQFLGRLKPPVFNYLSLIGLHEKFLNDLIQRFEEKIIPDIVFFLDENWSRAVFHDRFGSFKEKLRQQAIQESDIQEIEKSLSDLLIQRKPPLLEGSEFRRFADMVSKDTRQLLEGMCIDFIRENADVLNTYYLPH